MPAAVPADPDDNDGGNADRRAADAGAWAWIRVSRIDYNVFEGFKCTGLPRVTLSRGAVTWMDGDLRAKPGAGKYVPRDPFPAVHVANSVWRELNAPHPVERVPVTP